MRLSVIDCDPAQTERIRAWRKANPAWTLLWLRRDSWLLINERRELTGLGWGELLRTMDDLSSAAPAPLPGRTAPAAVPAIRPVPGELPDLLA